MQTLNVSSPEANDKQTTLECVLLFNIKNSKCFFLPSARLLQERNTNTMETLPWLAGLMPRWVRLVVKLPVLFEELREGKATVSSGSSGVDNGGGNWMLVRSGNEPPVLWAAGSNDGFNSWSGDGKILVEKKQNKQTQTMWVRRRIFVWHKTHNNYFIMTYGRHHYCNTLYSDFHRIIQYIIAHLIPGTSHVLGFVVSSCRQNVNMRCSFWTANVHVVDPPFPISTFLSFHNCFWTSLSTFDSEFSIPGTVSSSTN